jgi:ABC-type nitrate/sulfonate/bicarbonate transport system substrate-binding protein
MRKKGLSFSILCLLLFAIIVKTVAAAQAPAKVIMTTGSFSEREAAMYVAQDHGFFRRYGLDLTFVHVRSGPVGMAALAAGESQLHEGSVTGAVLGSAAEGTDLVFVAGMINKLIGNIMASPKIKNPAELKGKVIGVTSPSGGSWMFTTLAVEYWGLDAKRDGISFRVLGDESVRSQALLNDTIAATHLGYTFAAPLKSRGFTNLADLARPTAYPLPKYGSHDQTQLYQLIAGGRRRSVARHRRLHGLHRSTGKQVRGSQEPGQWTSASEGGTSRGRLRELAHAIR